MSPRAMHFVMPESHEDLFVALQRTGTGFVQDLHRICIEILYR